MFIVGKIVVVLKMVFLGIEFMFFVVRSINSIYRRNGEF